MDIGTINPWSKCGMLWGLIYFFYHKKKIKTFQKKIIQKKLFKKKSKEKLGWRNHKCLHGVTFHLYTSTLTYSLYGFDEVISFKTCSIGSTSKFWGLFCNFEDLFSWIGYNIFCSKYFPSLATTFSRLSGWPWIPCQNKFLSFEAEIDRNRLNFLSLRKNRVAANQSGLCVIVQNYW